MLDMGADKNGRNRYHKTWLRHCNSCLPLMSAAMCKLKSEISGKSLSQIVQSKGDIFVSNCSSTLQAVGSVRRRMEAHGKADVELTITDKLFIIKVHMCTYDASYIADHYLRRIRQMFKYFNWYYLDVRIVRTVLTQKRQNLVLKLTKSFITSRISQTAWGLKQGS